MTTLRAAFRRTPSLAALAIIGAALAILGACSPATPDPDPDESVGERLEARQTGFLFAVRALDADRTAEYFADDAVLHVAGMPPIEGRDAIRGFYGNVFQFMSASEPVPESLSISTAGDMAYTVGRVTNAFRSEGGSVEYAGKFLLVWEKRAEQWAIVVYALSSNEPDPGR